MPEFIITRTIIEKHVRTIKLFYSTKERALKAAEMDWYLFGLEQNGESIEIINDSGWQIETSTEQGDLPKK